jgi:hypothetical protein
VEALEKGLRSLDGVLSAKAHDVRGPGKFYYTIKVKESAALTPSKILKLQKGTPLEDYPLVGFVVEGLAGDVEKTPGGLAFTAQGSKQRYTLKSGPALDKLVAEGKLKVTLGGRVAQAETGDPVLEAAEAVERK